MVPSSSLPRPKPTMLKVPLLTDLNEKKKEKNIEQKHNPDTNEIRPRKDVPIFSHSMCNAHPSLYNYS